MDEDTAAGCGMLLLLLAVGYAVDASIRWIWSWLHWTAQQLLPLAPYVGLAFCVLGIMWLLYRWQVRCRAPSINSSASATQKSPALLDVPPVVISMRKANANALIGEENGLVCMIEDHADPDGRMYRMEYQATPDGRHAIAWCRQNPWGRRPNAGVGYASGHVRGDGLICLGNGATDEVSRSPYSFGAALQRGRYWCTAFSVYKETGHFPNP